MPARPKSIAIAAVALAVLLAGGWFAWLPLCPTESPAPVTEEVDRAAVIYPDGAQAEKDIAAALAQAAREKKRVLLDFGGNWCGDCQVLEIYFHDPANRRLLEANYVLVPVNIGRYDENLDIAARYGVPVSQRSARAGRARAQRPGGLQPAQRRVRGHAQTGFGFGDCLPSAVEGLKPVSSGPNSSWPRHGLHVPSMAWPVRSKNSASPC